MQDLFVPGDLVTPINGFNGRLVILSNWGDLPVMDKSFWPKIIGTLSAGETAVVVATYYPKASGIIGVQICTNDDIVGWVSASGLRAIR